jgi:Spy/CpxP family protein refolding chaperone
MRPKLMMILLAVSLIANVFFAGGALYAYYSQGDRGSGRQISRQLDLTSAQVQGLKALRETVAARRAAMPESHGGLRTALLAEIGNPTFDRERVETLLTEWSAERRSYFLDTAQDLHTYVASLTPAQREKFLELAQDRSFLRRMLRGRR